MDAELRLSEIQEFTYVCLETYNSSMILSTLFTNIMYYLFQGAEGDRKEFEVPLNMYVARMHTCT